VNALLRIENVDGQLPGPFEQPRDDMSFWVLELLEGVSEDLDSWQSRIIPILQSKLQTLLACRKTGSTCCLHVETYAEPQGFPATFKTELLKTLGEFDGVLEHVVDFETEE